MKINNGELISLMGPFQRWHNDDNQQRMKFRDGGHCPDNKRPGQVKSTLDFTIDRNVKGDWVSFQMEEITTHEDSGRIKGRTISTTIPLEMAKRIAQFVIDGAKK